ncbi:hypothetical protein Tco_0340093 [Tanacetum coccineum]
MKLVILTRHLAEMSSRFCCVYFCSYKVFDLCFPGLTGIEVRGGKVVLPLLGSVIVSLLTALGLDDPIYRLLCHRIWHGVIVLASRKVHGVSTDPPLLTIIIEL